MKPHCFHTMPQEPDETIKTIGRFNEIFCNLKEHSPNRTIYRGEKISGKKLIPSVGRMVFTYVKDKRKLIDEEKWLLKKFKQRALNHLSFHPTNDWDWLALAQHYRLPTRLLDWSLNPLVAAFFAVEDEMYDGESVIYIAKGVEEVELDKQEDSKLWEGDQVKRFVPRHVTPRLTSQTGVFTIHPKPEACAKDDLKVTTITIHRDLRRDLRRLLFVYGVSEASIYADLDGLGRHIKYLRIDSKKTEERRKAKTSESGAGSKS